MNLLALLSNSASSLEAQETVLAVSGDNIENASTPGYVQQQVNLAELGPSVVVGNTAVGGGAEVASVTQTTNSFVEAQMPAAFSNASSSSAEAQALEGVTVLDTSSTNDLSTALGNFYSAMQAVTQDAGNTSLRQAAIASAQALATSFNTASEGIAAARSGLDSQISGQVTQVNQLATQVAQLNGEIAAAEASGGNANSLLDSRQTALDTLAQLAGATTVSGQNGEVSVMLGGGLALVSGTVAGSLATAVDASNGGHLAVQLELPGSSAASSLPSSALGGTVGGELTARDQVLGTAAANLDTLAFDFATSVNAVHEAGYGLDGVTGRPLFDVGTTSSGAAGSIAVDSAVANDPDALAAAASAAGVPGDASQIQALVNTQSQVLGNGLTATAGLAAITTQFGAATEQAQAVSTQDAGMLSNLQSMRSSAEGVSIDEQLINLQQAQRAYEAISRVIQTTSNLLDNLLQLT